MSAAALDSLIVERFSWISCIVSKAKLSKLFKDTSSTYLKPYNYVLKMYTWVATTIR
jgi:hypothetical protein